MSFEIPEQVVQRFSEAESVAVLTGSGVSAESGVPTFRDAQTGLWAQFRPEELATPEAFETNPRRVWEWYAWRRNLVAAANPNPGHTALARLQTLFPQFTLITQNVDGLHQAAGSAGVIELHGNIRRTRCHEGGHPVERWEDSGEVPPRCAQCGGRLRPDVVWFNEVLPIRELNRAIEASRCCDVFLLVGTSALVYPAALLPIEALATGAILIEVNPIDTSLSNRCHAPLRGPAADVLPALTDRIAQRK